MSKYTFNAVACTAIHQEGFKKWEGSPSKSKVLGGVDTPVLYASS